MSKVFDTHFDWGEGAPSEPTIKLVMLALADHASDTGEAVYPSIAHVCAKTGLSRQTVKNVLSAARDQGVLVAIGRRKQVIEYRMTLEGHQVTRTPGVPVPGHHVSLTRPPGVHVTINEPSKEPPCADARASTPSGRDPMDTHLAFEALKAHGRAAGKDAGAEAHPLAGTPHLVALCQAFERAAGFYLVDLPKSRRGLWRKDLEDLASAGVTADDVQRLVSYARSHKWQVLRPGSLTNAVGEVRRKQGGPQPRQSTELQPSW